MSTTARPWSVNATLNGRIVGDETAHMFDKLMIHGPNATVATVCRPKDARLIVRAVNNYDRLVEALRTLTDFVGGTLDWDGDDHADTYDALRAARAALKAAGA